MSHRRRIGVVCIDCRTDDLADAMAFWSAVLGGRAEVDTDGKYAAIEGLTGPRVLLQAVDQDPRVHLDIETDDCEAEAARLTGLGAVEVARIRSWIVMEAPTGHRVGPVGPQGEDLPGDPREVAR